MALLRHSGIYFLARILSGAAGFAIIAAYTRLLDPHQFGELALVLAGVGFCGMLLGDTPTLALLRFLPENSAAARATLLWGLLLPFAAICVLAMAAFAVAAPAHWRLPLVIAAALVLTTLLHKFQLATAQGGLKPGQYALLGGLESILDMVFGIAFVWLGYGIAGALAGTTLGLAITLVLNWRGWWVGRSFYDSALARQFLRFGLPLMASGLFGWLATFADRWLLGFFVGTNETGLYAAGYDLQMNLLGVPLMVMQLAGYPLTITALSERGAQAAQEQLRAVGSFMLLIMLPEAVGLVMIGPLLVGVFLGAEYRPLALALLPILVTATVLKSLISYLSYGFFLASRTGVTLITIAAAAAVDLVLNFVLIPHYGPWGAAIASLAGFGAGFVVAAAMMRKVFAFPLPDPMIVLAALAGVGAMTLWLLPFYGTTVLASAFYIVPVAILIDFAAVFLVLYASGRKPLALIRSLWGEQARRAAG